MQKTGFLIWGRAKSPRTALPSNPIAPPTESRQIIKNKLKETSEQSLFQPTEHDNVLQQFSGEPQIVHAIRQLTFTSSRDPGYSLSGSQTPVVNHADPFKGTCFTAYHETLYRVVLSTLSGSSL